MKRGVHGRRGFAAIFICVLGLLVGAPAQAEQLSLAIIGSQSWLRVSFVVVTVAAGVLAARVS